MHVGNCSGKTNDPVLPRRVESQGINLSCICKVKIVCASIGSQGIPGRRDISARLDITDRREHACRP